MYIPATSIWNDTTFLIETITDFINTIAWIPGQIFGQKYETPFVYPATAKLTEGIKLTNIGVALMFYIRIYKEPYPSGRPNQEQIDRMKHIWSSMGQPENTIPM